MDPATKAALAALGIEKPIREPSEQALNALMKTMRSLGASGELITELRDQRRTADEVTVAVAREHPVVLLLYFVGLVAGGGAWVAALIGSSPASSILVGIGGAALVAALIVEWFHSVVDYRSIRWAVGGPTLRRVLQHHLLRCTLGLLILLGALALLRYTLPGWVVVTVAAGVTLVMRWIDRRTYTVTNRRVIVQHGVIDRVAEMYWLERIERIEPDPNWHGHAGFSDVVMYPAGGGAVKLRHIPKEKLSAFEDVATRRAASGATS